MSTIEFLNNFFPQLEQIIINLDEVLSHMNLVKYVINKNDIIIISGGGYFGLYDHVIEAQTNIIKRFPNNHIILFPCSILYNNRRIQKYQQFINIFNNHSDITLFTRESKSYETALNLFINNTIYNVPDIVTRLNISNFQKIYNREGILLILRKDELLLTNDNRKFIRDLVKKYFNNNVFEKDSNNFKIPPGSGRKNETINFINIISQKQLVITDRLHGMILSIIAGTPCIVFGNNYHKVESSYFSWFKDLEYVTFIQQKDIEKELEEKIIKFKNLNNYEIFNSKMFDQYYLLMKNIIQSKINLILEKKN